VQKLEGDAIHVGLVRAGEYFAAAVTADDYVRFRRDDPRAYALLAAVGRRITLVEKGRQTIDLQLAQLDTVR
jgi:hypothetical protein